MTSDPVYLLAREMLDAHSTGQPVPVPPSARDGGCDLDMGYAVEAELVRLRRAAGRSPAGRKIGLVNPAVWRALNMKTLAWATIYDDTVQFAKRGEGAVSLARMRAPRIEPEIAIRLQSVPTSADPVAALEAIEWMALAFEIVDCPYPEWKFQPGDFLASFGFHAALLVGEPRQVRKEEAAALVEQLGRFTVELSKNGEVAERGGGVNVLENPALCVAEFLRALPRQPGPEPLRAGEILSTGSLTAAPPVVAGERWHVEAEGLDIAPLAVNLTA